MTKNQEAKNHSDETPASPAHHHTGDDAQNNRPHPQRNDAASEVTAWISSLSEPELREVIGTLKEEHDFSLSQHAIQKRIAAGADDPTAAYADRIFSKVMALDLARQGGLGTAYEACLRPNKKSFSTGGKRFPKGSILAFCPDDWDAKQTAAVLGIPLRTFYQLRKRGVLTDKMLGCTRKNRKTVTYNSEMVLDGAFRLLAKSLRRQVSQ